MRKLEEGLKLAKVADRRFEPAKIVDTTSENEVFDAVRPALLPRQDSNLRPIA